MNIPTASKAVRPRAKSVHKTQVKGNGKGTCKGKSTKKKLGKATAVVNSDSEDLEVDSPHHPPNQTQDIPAEQPQKPNQPVNVPVEGPQDPNHPLDIAVEGPGEPEGSQQPKNIPAGEAEPLQEPNNPDPLPAQPPVPMENNQLNCFHFKPDFSGKAEEDAEVHLLRTNDWMMTHDFPEDQKVRRFCLTLSGEARLWYKTLNAQQQQLNWVGLQDRFRQQYSKFGNTREQYFHVWRSFQFDEATNTIDRYIQKVKQVAALLDYGEPQILELFKNTLLSRLYYMFYQIDNLRVVVETAKRLLTKEQMDKKAGQSTTSLFMQVSQGSSRNKDKSEKSEKKVSFCDVEAMERTSDSIGRLASLMDKMDTKLGRREDQYRPRVYQGRGRGHGYRQNNYWSRNRSYSRDQYQNNYRGRRNYDNRGGNRNYRSNYRDNSRSKIKTTTEIVIDTTIDQIIEGKTVTKGMVIETRTAADPGIEIEIGEIGVTPEKVPNQEAVVDPKTDMRTGDRVEMIPEIGTGLN